MADGDHSPALSSDDEPVVPDDFYLPGIPASTPPAFGNLTHEQFRAKLAQLLVRLHLSIPRLGRPSKPTFARLLAQGMRRPGAHGPKRDYDDEFMREWIGVIESAKKHFGVPTDKEAIRRIERELGREAGTAHS